LSWQERVAQFLDDNRLLLAIVFTVVVGIALTYTVISRRREVQQSS
jgi:hypothetical protein